MHAGSTTRISCAPCARNVKNVMLFTRALFNLDAQKSTLFNCFISGPDKFNFFANFVRACAKPNQNNEESKEYYKYDFQP